MISRPAVTGCNYLGDIATWYGVHPKRGIEAVNAFGVLKDYVGVLVHDCWAPYWLIQCVHACMRCAMRTCCAS
ncbi:hypothetical protein D5041_04905 [Verminephrobacter aporrectodeae subsp. tuberculatae]|nr:hypothetical protein [Verminephrobacter aporrectodeae subsp. tuberculatae]MCW5288421.1 hypothetical protein [Verminephrobacter aporrectodeae subsp. tuberculatae]